MNDFINLVELREYCFSMDTKAQDEMVFTQVFSKMSSDWRGTVNNAKKYRIIKTKRNLKVFLNFKT